ncbi:hypothetical protein Pla144_49720 [Bythopirellula polymerisocia]|uniref:Uncharacterized protein n=1 Tax=Bythopirellula polymerisocia TaxID=2528003 RepID=A0A5C6C8A3_9BACT|nr:hypothetical protein Pla144_49720 [Bythopirellula polymerisocia]
MGSWFVPDLRLMSQAIMQTGIARTGIIVCDDGHFQDRVLNAV